jgi:hypothetical protein
LGNAGWHALSTDAKGVTIRVYEDLDRALDELADRLIARQREEREERETRENAVLHTDAGDSLSSGPYDIETPD